MNLKKHSLAVLVIAMVIISVGLWLWALNWFSVIDTYDKEDDMVLSSQKDGMDTSSSEPLDTIDSAVNQKLLCDADRPKSGSKYALGTAKINLNESAILFIGNEHDYPVWVRLFEYESSQEFGAIFLAPHQNSQFRLPENGYRVVVESGTEWCNLQTGFVDTATVHSEKVVNIIKYETASLRLLSYGLHPADIMLSLSSSKLSKTEQQKVQGMGTLTLQRVLGGHYAVEGSVNGRPVNFMVDTGATNVSLPENFAKHAGITACKKTKLRTANGIVDTCKAFARELSIGQFTLRNVEVSYGKGLPEDTFLLGMNVISQFKMVQKEGVMVLSRK